MATPEVGTFEWFESTFWPIHPIAAKGNGSSVRSAYGFANGAINSYNGKTLAGGVELTWEELLKRYTDFFNYMKDQQNGQYTKKENTLLCIEDYCFQKKFESDYSSLLVSTMSSNNDKYLFGF